MKLIRFILSVAVLALLSSCISASLFRGSSALESGNWYMARSDPPTYFPIGVDPDHPTRFSDGYWVHAEDSMGTQFFIPLEGSGDLSQEQLIEEAQAAMKPEKKRRLRMRMLREEIARAMPHITVGM